MFIWCDLAFALQSAACGKLAELRAPAPESRGQREMFWRDSLGLFGHCSPFSQTRPPSLPASARHPRKSLILGPCGALAASTCRCPLLAGPQQRFSAPMHSHPVASTHLDHLSRFTDFTHDAYTHTHFISFNAMESVTDARLAKTNSDETDRRKG